MKTGKKKPTTPEKNIKREKGGGGGGEKLADRNDPTIMRSNCRYIKGMQNDAAKSNSTNDMTQLQIGTNWCVHASTPSLTSKHTVSYNS
jgi:hypothetical protein